MEALLIPAVAAIGVVVVVAAVLLVMALRRHRRPVVHLGPRPEDVAADLESRLAKRSVEG